MIVSCTTSIADSLPPSAYDSRQGVNPDTEYPVTPGRSYAVFGITVNLGLTWYYILDDDDLDWPVWAPAPLFEVIDGCLPSSWQFGYHWFTRDSQFPLISFPEWANDHLFYERLVDGEPGALATFAQRRLEIEAIE